VDWVKLMEIRNNKSQGEHTLTGCCMQDRPTLSEVI
jgi:hypothetical protein